MSQQVISFECPECGECAIFPTAFAGQTRPCPNCSATLDIPDHPLEADALPQDATEGIAPGAGLWKCNGPSDEPSPLPVFIPLPACSVLSHDSIAHGEGERILLEFWNRFSLWPGSQANSSARALGLALAHVVVHERTLEEDIIKAGLLGFVGLSPGVARMLFIVDKALRARTAHANIIVVGLTNRSLYLADLGKAAIGIAPNGCFTVPFGAVKQLSDEARLSDLRVDSAKLDQIDIYQRSDPNKLATTMKVDGAFNIRTEFPHSFSAENGSVAKAIQAAVADSHARRMPYEIVSQAIAFFGHPPARVPGYSLEGEGPYGPELAAKFLARAAHRAMVAAVWKARPPSDREFLVESSEAGYFLTSECLYVKTGDSPITVRAIALREIDSCKVFGWWNRRVRVQLLSGEMVESQGFMCPDTGLIECLRSQLVTGR